MVQNKLNNNRILMYRSETLNIPLGHEKIMKILDLQGEAGLWTVSKKPECILIRDAKFWFLSAGPYIWIHIIPIDGLRSQIYIDIGLPPARIIFAILFFFLFTVGGINAHEDQYSVLQVLIIDVLIFLFTIIPLYIKKDKVYELLLEKLSI